MKDSRKGTPKGGSEESTLGFQGWPEREPAGFGKIFSVVLFVVLYFSGEASGEAISSILEVLQVVLSSSYWALKLKYWYIYWMLVRGFLGY